VKTPPDDAWECWEHGAAGEGAQRSLSSPSWQAWGYFMGMEVAVGRRGAGGGIEGTASGEERASRPRKWRRKGRRALSGWGLGWAVTWMA
jgi:hypothetical protein